MKLALLSPDGVVHCLLCHWQERAPGKRRDRRQHTEVVLSATERFQVLERDLLAHLQSSHERILVQREEVTPAGTDTLPKVYYHGRRPQ